MAGTSATPLTTTYSTKTVKDKVILYISQGSNPLPLEETVNDTTVHGSQVEKFTSWGKSFSVSAPTRVIPISKFAKVK